MRSVTMYMYSWSWKANRRRHKKGWSSCSRMVLSRMILRTASIRIHSSLLIYFNAYNWRDSRCSTIRTYSNLKSLELMKPIIQRIIWSFVTFPNAPRPTIRISLNWDRFTRKGGVYVTLIYRFDVLVWHAVVPIYLCHHRQLDQHQLSQGQLQWGLKGNEFWMSGRDEKTKKLVP